MTRIHRMSSAILGVLGLLAAGALTGCVNEQAVVNGYTNRLRFSQDPRSGLCFAFSGVKGGWSISNVPCDRVQGLIEPVPDDDGPGPAPAASAAR